MIGRMKSEFQISILHFDKFFKSYMRDPKLILVGNDCEYDEEAETLQIIGGGLDCSVFGSHSNPMLTTLTPAKDVEN